MFVKYDILNQKTFLCHHCLHFTICVILVEVVKYYQRVHK